MHQYIYIDIQHIDDKLANMMQVMSTFAQNFPAGQSSINRSAIDMSSNGAALLSREGETIRPESSGQRSGALTTHVWPKSRMLFAVVSKMSKEGALNSKQRGVLKDLILESDSRLLQMLQEYESGGNRDKLYDSFQQVANQKY